MTGVRINEDILLSELFEILPEAKEILENYGYSKIREVEDVVLDKLSLKGFCRLVGMEEGEVAKVVKEISDLYNSK